MAVRRFVLFAVLAAARFAAAQPGDFNVVVDSVRPPFSEDSALLGFVMLKEGASGSRAVGSVGRAYSASRGPDNTVWGVVTEGINFPSARGNVVGTESAVVNMSHDNEGELRGIDLVFKDRMDADIDNPVPLVGDNRFNDHSAAVYVSSQPRSGAGEYSGWQSGIKFDKSSLDRSVSVPYTAAIDVSEVQTAAPFYLVVWRCGEVKCGLKPTADGAIIVADIDHAK